MQELVVHLGHIVTKLIQNTIAADHCVYCREFRVLVLKHQQALEKYTILRNMKCKRPNRSTLYRQNNKIRDLKKAEQQCFQNLSHILQEVRQSCIFIHYIPELQIVSHFPKVKMNMLRMDCQ